MMSATVVMRFVFVTVTYTTTVAADLSPIFTIVETLNFGHKF